MIFIFNSFVVIFFDYNFVYLWCLVNSVNMSLFFQRSGMSRITNPINITQRFLIKLKSGKEGSRMPKLPITRKEIYNELSGRDYRQIADLPLVDNTIPIIVDAFPEPYIPSTLRKVESAQGLYNSNPPTRGAAITYINMEDISEDECEFESDRESDRENKGQSLWKKCKLEPAAPPKTIWGDSATYCYYDCSTIAGFSGVTCISEDEASSMDSDSENDDNYFDDLDDDNFTEDNLVPNSYYFGSPTSLRELLKTYNTMCGM